MLQEQPEDIPQIKEGKETRKTTIIFDKAGPQQQPMVIQVRAWPQYNRNKYKYLNSNLI